MSKSSFPSPAELPHQVRAAAFGLRGRLRAWGAEVKEDPTLLWRTPLIRISFYLLLGIGLFLGVRWGTGALVAAGAAKPPPPPTAMLYVVCTNPECLHSFAVTVARDFKEWPMKCGACGQLAVFRGTVCKVCRNWYAVAPGGPDGCPHCRKKTNAAKPASKPKSKPATGDDAEDGWN